MLDFEESLLKEIKEVDWFVNVGAEIFTLEKLLQVSSWDECEERFTSYEWEDTTLEANNELSVFLHKKRINEFNQWNELTIKGQDYFKVNITPVLEKLEIPVKERNVLIACVRWDIIGYMMEEAYKKFNGPRFFTQLFKFYKQGHFPCGWEGDWPDGKLVVF